MGTWCTTPSNTKPQAETNNNISKSLNSTQIGSGGRQRKNRQKAKEPEPEIDYSDFRNNPILKPAPLENPQDNASSSEDLAVSMASAAKLQNLQPKDEGESRGTVEFGADMKNEDDTVEEVSSSQNNIPKEPEEMWVSFKPSNLETNGAEDDSLSMSFGGAKLQSQKESIASTGIQEANEEGNDL